LDLYADQVVLYARMKIRMLRTKNIDGLYEEKIEVKRCNMKCKGR